MKYLLLLFSITFHGQILHHQMISSQGTTKKAANGVIVKQTVGQMSSSGNYDSNNMIVGQGFQQSSWERLIVFNDVNLSDDVKIFPNPFVDIIKFQFLKPIAEIISVSIFDQNGRLVFVSEENVEEEQIMTLDLSRLPSSMFLVRLKSFKFNYYIKIIKQS